MVAHRLRGSCFSVPVPHRCLRVRPDDPFLPKRVAAGRASFDRSQPVLDGRAPCFGGRCRSKRVATPPLTGADRRSPFSIRVAELLARGPVSAISFCRIASPARRLSPSTALRSCRIRVPGGVPPRDAIGSLLIGRCSPRRRLVSTFCRQSSGWRLVARPATAAVRVTAKPSPARPRRSVFRFASFRGPRYRPCLDGLGHPRFSLPADLGRPLQRVIEDCLSSPLKGYRTLPPQGASQRGASASAGPSAKLSRRRRQTEVLSDPHWGRSRSPTARG